MDLHLNVDLKMQMTIGEKTRLVNAPNTNKLVLVSPTIHTKIYQHAATRNPHTHKPLMAI